DHPMDAPSATKIHEADLVRWLVCESPAGRMLLEQLGIEDQASGLFEIPTERLCSGASAPGDVDLLLIPAKDTQQCIAFECKRITIPPAAFHTGLPGKLRGLERGVRQANALARIGFSRVFLMVVMVTDAREQAGGFWCGSTPELIKLVDNCTV